LTWETLWAVGRYDLRLTDAEFWGMVPRQFAALMDRRKDAMLRREFSVGLICSSAFTSRGMKMSPMKFMPSWQEEEETKPEASWQEDRAKFMQAAGVFGGVQ